MNKTVEKILLAPINAIVWLSHNPAETMLLLIFAFSFCPFFMHIASPAMLGGFMAFLTCILKTYVFKYEKTTRLYNILLIIILAIGTISFFIIAEKTIKDEWSSTEKLLSTYLGSFWGVMVAHFFISFIDGERDERKKWIEMKRREMERKSQLRIISQKEREGFVAIKKEGELIGYIEKGKYDEFVKQNVLMIESLKEHGTLL